MLLRRGLYLFLLVFLLPGCSKTSFLGKRYENFTAYYNTFFNAKKLYGTGVDALERASENEIDRNRYVPIFVTPDRVSNQQNFNDAIKKSADVLRENPTSKWVDDALMLIGKSYFYLQNYVGAEQKFEEVIALGGSLEDEARFWMGRTYLASGSLSRARDHLEGSLNREGLSSDWEPMLRMVLGELHVREESWADAANEFERGLQNLKDKDLSARAQFLLGQVYETLGQYESAIQSFSRVPRYKPEYPLIYAANISVVRVETEHGDPDKALRLLRGMERDDKNFDRRAEMGYFKGRIYQAKNQSDDAFITFDELLYNDDQTLNISRVKGHIHYALGELIRDDYIDFTYASAHFDTAQTSLRAITRSARGARQEQFTPEAIVDSETQAEVLGSFATVHDEIAAFDSLLWLGSMEQEAFDAFILEMRKELGKEMIEEQQELARKEAENRFRNTTNISQSGSRKVIDGPEGGQPTSDQGFLFHRDRIRIQEGKQSFLLIWGNRPLVPNWRRLEAIQNAELAEGDSDESPVSGVDLSNVELSDDFLPVVDYSDVPRDDASKNYMESQLALVRYELANVLFLSMERPDSAAAWYRMVIDETGDLPVAQRAYYALAEVQRALGDNQSAERLYREVLDRYPESDFANQVRERLGMPTQIEVVSDSVALAEAAYQEAYKMWQQQNYKEAVTNMVMLASNYEVPDMAPRALLATGTIYLEWAERDQMDVYALPPPEVPDSILFAQGLVDSTFLYQTSYITVPVEGAESTTAEQRYAFATSPAFKSAADQVFRADSLRVLSEELLNRSDSLYVVSDSYYGQSDSLQVLSDSLYSQSEQLQLQSERLFLQADSIQSRASTVLSGLGVRTTSSDSLRYFLATNTTVETQTIESQRVGKRLKIDRLYTAVKDRFPRTEHAEYADQMLRALVDLRPAQDSVLVRTLAEEDIQRVIEEMPEEERYMRGPGGVDTTAVGWTLVVASFSDIDRAEVLRREYEDKGFRSGVIQGATRFRVGIGQFPGLDEARTGLATYKDQLPPTTWFLDLEKPK